MSSKQQFYKRFDSASDANSKLEISVGFDSNYGYYVRATPMKVKDYNGIEMVQFKGADIEETLVIEAKSYSEKKWNKFVNDLQGTLDLYFADNPKIQEFMRGG